MANNWKYFQQTGKQGGTPNPSDDVYYTDSHNGSDVTGDGSHDNPFATIQKCIDASTTIRNDIVCAGVFKEGDFVGQNSQGSIIPEGVVVIDGDGFTNFVPFSSLIYINRSWASGGFVGTFGRALIKNYNSVSFLGEHYNTDYENIDTLMNATTYYVEGCSFKNCDIGGAIGSLVGSGSLLTVFEHNSLFNTDCTIADQQNVYFRNNFIDAPSKVDFATNGQYPIELDFNHFEGTLTNKIQIGTASYNNTEALQLAEPTIAVNDVASTVDPLLNEMNNKDYTLAEGSPLAAASKTGREIGTFKVAKAIDASDVAWTLVNIDNTTTSGEAVLSGSPTGTMETLAGVELFPKSRKVTRINLPDFEFNSPLGEMIGNLAADNTPYLLDVEIKYSDDNITFNTNWLRTAVGVQPMHDTTNDVGTDDPLYSVATAEAIVCRYMKFKITLRDNETQI